MLSFGASIGIRSDMRLYKKIPRIETFTNDCKLHQASQALTYSFLRDAEAKRIRRPIIGPQNRA